MARRIEPATAGEPHGTTQNIDGAAALAAGRARGIHDTRNLDLAIAGIEDDGAVDIAH